MTAKRHTRTKTDSNDIYLVPNCSACGLYQTCLTPKMEPEGPLDSEVLIVAEAPGANEDKIGRPLIGESGQMLRTALVRAGIEKPYSLSTTTSFHETPHTESVVLYNTVICRPPNNATPTASQISYCFPNVLNLISRMNNLKLIVLIGNVALRAFTGKQGITKLSGTMLEWVNPVSNTTYTLMPLIHPASFLHARNRTNIDIFYNHVARINKKDDNTQTDRGEYMLIQSIDDWYRVRNEIYRAGKFSYDIETTGLQPHAVDQYIKVISFSTEPKKAYALPLNGWNAGEFDIICNDIAQIFSNPNIRKIGHNIKFDNLWIQVFFDTTIDGPIDDTKLSQYILHPNASSHLKDMAYTYTRLGGYEKDLPTSVQDVPIEKLWEYCCIDADICHRIYLHHAKEFEQDVESYNVYRNLLLETSMVLTKMEQTGIKIDTPKLHNIAKRIKLKIEEALEYIKEHESVKKYVADTKTEFNPNSHKQLIQLLFSNTYENLTPIKFTAASNSKIDKTPSTDKTVLAFYKDTNELAKRLYDYSQYKALEKITKELVTNLTVDNRIHTTFWLTETRSGRSSSSDPNLQNIPKGEKDVVGIRRAFIADPGYILVECDFNQHELRCMAEEADDDKLREAVLTGDVHRATAANVLGIDPKDVTDEQRRTIGKVFNFGIIYGMTIFGIIKRMGLVEKFADKLSKSTQNPVDSPWIQKQARILAEQEAQHMLDRFFSVYHKTKEWMDKTIEFVKENRYVKIRSGFKKYFPEDIELTDHELRSAINLPIQGLAGHILFYALIGVDKFLTFNRFKSKLLLEVHDSILLEVHKTELDILPEIKHIMCNYFKKFIPHFKTPISVDVKIGDNWKDMVSWNL